MTVLSPFSGLSKGVVLKQKAEVNSEEKGKKFQGISISIDIFCLFYRKI